LLSVEGESLDESEPASEETATKEVAGKQNTAEERIEKKNQ
jgi:hypothetical protein